jgi:hypothetical protein
MIKIPGAMFPNINERFVILVSSRKIFVIANNKEKHVYYFLDKIFIESSGVNVASTVNGDEI